MNNTMIYDIIGYAIILLMIIAFLIILSFTISIIFNELRYFFKKKKDSNYKRTFIENYTTKNQSKFIKFYLSIRMSGGYDEDISYWIIFGTIMVLNITFLGILYYLIRTGIHNMFYF